MQFSKNQGRLLYIDGLRGVAAILVIFFHLYYRATSPLHPVLARMPGVITWGLDRGWIGVDIFFVLSGFVIARSLLNDRITPAFFGRFVLRRSIRLDPPYWIILLLVVLLKWIASPKTHGHVWFAAYGFSFGTVLLNGVYLQTLLGKQMILGVSWTLCLEILFYITCAIGLGATQLSLKGPEDDARPARWMLYTVFGPTFLLSAWCWYELRVGQNGHESGLHMYLGYWHMFLLGAILQWSLSGWLPDWSFAIALLVVAAGVIHQLAVEEHGLAAAGLIAVLTSVSIWVADRYNRSNRWLAHGLVQSAGRLSYSLYLVHLPIFTIVLNVAVRSFGLTVKACVVGIPIALAATVVAAIFLNRLVERPSLRLSKMIKAGV